MEYYMHCRIEFHNRLVELGKNCIEGTEVSQLISPLKTMEENSCPICIQPIYNIWGSSCMAKPDEENKKETGCILVERPCRQCRKHVRNCEKCSADDNCPESIDKSQLKKMSCVSKLQKICISDSSFLVGIKFPRCGNHFYHLDCATHLIKENGVQCPVCRIQYNKKSNEEYCEVIERVVVSINKT